MRVERTTQARAGALESHRNPDDRTGTVEDWWSCDFSTHTSERYRPAYENIL